MTTVAGFKSVSLSKWCYEARATLGREVGGAEQKSFPPDFGNGLGAHRLVICKPMHYPPDGIHRTRHATGDAYAKYMPVCPCICAPSPFY